MAFHAFFGVSIMQSTTLFAADHFGGLGLPWWVVCGAFLIAYNAGHLAARIYGFRLGWDHGMDVAEKLRQSWVAEVQRRITTTGAFLLGVLLPLIAGGQTLALPHPLIAGAVAVVGVLFGLRFGNAVRTPVVLALVGFVLLGLFMRWL